MRLDLHVMCLWKLRTGNSAYQTGLKKYIGLRISQLVRHDLATQLNPICSGVSAVRFIFT